MSQPTTSMGFSPTTPAAPTGNQNTVPQSDGGTPLEKFSQYPQKATSSLLGVVVPDGTTITVDGSGKISAVTSLAETTKTIGIVIDGAGSVPSTGAKGFIQFPDACAITGWTILADQSGSAQITVSKGAYAAYPTVSSIDASLPPKLTSTQKNTSTTLTGWTTSIAAGDILSFNLDSVTSCKRIVLQLQVTLTPTTDVLGIVLDGNGSVPATGAKGFIQVPYNCTVIGWTLLADQSGSAQVSISKGTYSGFPTVSSIDASAPPALSSAQKNASATLSGWTTALSAGDILSFNLDSISTINRLVLQLQIVRS